MALPEQLHLLAPQVVERAVASLAPAAEERARLAVDALALVTALAAGLGADRLTTTPAPMDGEAASARHVALLRALKVATHDAVEALQPPATARQTRLIGDYFATATEAALQAQNLQLQEALRRSEARFRFTLANAKITVFETDEALRIRWICDSHLDIDEPQLMGKTTDDFFPDDVNARLMELKRHVLTTGEGARTEIATELRGEKRHLLINYERVRGGGGITGASIDITEAKKVEEELARELAFRERMMGVLGHDLRNPVSAILGIAGLLQLPEDTTDKARQGLQLIEQSARRMSEMIGTLLDFTQVRFRGTLPVTRAPLDLAALCRTVVDELRAAHPGRELTVTAPGEIRGEWDAGRIAQLVSNLVANALTHGAPRSAVEVTLALAGEEATLTVENHGATIPPELIGHIFEPFEQGRPESRGRGLGLGLFIVRAIATAHGGRVDVYSADDVTRFVVRLPRTGARP